MAVATLKIAQQELRSLGAGGVRHAVNGRSRREKGTEFRGVMDVRRAG